MELEVGNRTDEVGSVDIFQFTVIPRVTSLRLHQMHKLIPFFFSIYEPIFAYTSSFLSQTDHCSRHLFLGSNGKLIFVLRIFALRTFVEDRIKLVNRGMAVFDYSTEN
jgi:hypothetical protein